MGFLMGLSRGVVLGLFQLSFLVFLCFSADPFAHFDLEVSYMDASPLGVHQQVIAVNGKFPGPVLNVTTNYNVVVNVRNKLDEELLITWPGIQMRRSSWQDGVLGTNCPIPAGWNWTYQFQVKDQVGSYFYFPSLNMQRAGGGFGSFVITKRQLQGLELPFKIPDADLDIMIGDWYTKSHKDLRADLESGKELGMPDGVLINGKGPYRYNDTLVPDGIEHETINVDPGKTYRFRVHNVGVSTCLNFRIQSHNLLLAEAEGTYTIQTNFSGIDIHVGQSYSFLVTMDQNASSDYYIVASARFVNESIWEKVIGVAVLHYSNSQGKASGPLPDTQISIYDTFYPLNQAMSVRLNVSASGARPNPQGSYPYGQIVVTDTYILRSVPPMKIHGKLRASYNGISFGNPKTPIRLADVYHVKSKDYKLDFPSRPMNRPPKIDTSIINATYKGFVEVVLENNDTSPQSFHIDGYSFYVVGMGFGNWSEDKRSSYNKWDAIFRSTTQVLPGGWTAIFVSLDNVGVWNLRTENLDRWYLGQETYMRIINPEDSSNKTELHVPHNALYCGALSYMQKEQKASFSAPRGANSRSSFTMLIVVLMVIFSLC